MAVGRGPWAVGRGPWAVGLKQFQKRFCNCFRNMFLAQDLHTPFWHRICIE
jgi:hypothetical protein